jgi:hypothetical protein
MVDSVATWNGRGKNTMDETHGGGKNSNNSPWKEGLNPTNFGVYP